MPGFTYVSDILHDEYPSLDVCKNDGNAISVLQWQCYGQLAASQFDGITITDGTFIKKAFSFIDIAKSTKASLVLSPEYSFPYEVIDNIIQNQSLHPEKGKLWCLGTQGINIDSLKQKMDLWSSHGALVIRHALELDVVKKFVSPLFYIFKTANDKLCILPQFKIGQMADARNSFEGAFLCTGNQIFIFNQEGSNNAFLSIICADVLHIDSNQIKDHVKQSSILLFHPQLNPNPRHDEFVNFRANLFRTSDRNIRIITLNWAEGTQCTPCTFNMPWSAFYMRKIQNLENDCFRNNKEGNHKKGTAYVSNSHIDIWFSHRIEHCKLMYICKGDSGDKSGVITNRDEPVTNSCYTFDNSSWHERSDFCSTNINLLRLRYEEFQSPYPPCENCDKCAQSDIFYGSLFGHFEEGEIKCTHEQPSRILVGSDIDNDSSERMRKYTLLLELQNLLKNGLFPKELKYFKNNYKFEISKYYSLKGGETYNLAPVTSPDQDSQALVVITDQIEEAEIDKLWKRLSGTLHTRYRNQILLYYRVVGSGYKCYGKYLNQIRYRDSHYSINPASYKKGISILKMFRRG